MRKAKTGGDFTVMEVSPHTSFGVRTRAKTLALQRLQNTSPTTEDSLSYLQLRSRRLEKVLQPMDKPEACKEAVRSSPIPNPSSSASAGMGTVFGGATAEPLVCPTIPNSVSVVLLSSRNDGLLEEADPGPPVTNPGFEVDVSFGENALDAEELNRNVRESTPICLIKDSNDVGTPGSSTKHFSSTSTNRTTRSLVSNNILTAQEIEDFFAESEQSQRILFTKKYNYDVVNDCPLPGRYEWIKLD
ncbi:hypothetical protein HPP92_005063 [Vanilla planifolia]|uniref:Cyclin-dependent kinase inhibitor domain-containing protein n=1 Tax=Vanilla planifolia TaxID=51239 RepID=A0A835RRH4_VANPL|nr:hypothetical protein HPP92_005399 [Vanilla planifolia]KAG0494069.1 hypothetical protein HPP92_005063 [Vanilla planifolia]